MQHSEEDQGGLNPGADAEAKSDAQLRAFAAALGRELDRIGYPAAPARTNQLSQDLGLGRMQAFRVGRGESMPTLKALVKLQSLGVSLDAVLAQLHDSSAVDDEIAVNILNVTLKATPLPAYGRTPFALSRRDGRAVLRVLKAGEELGDGDALVGGLRFTRPQPLVAVVDDDRDDLAVLGREIRQGFSANLFRSGQNLLDDATDLCEYDALVLDWRLPDMDGTYLVNQVRAQTRAPIIITTGERREAQAISAVLHLPNIRYADKPVDGNLLRAMIDAAIAEAGVAPSSPTAWLTRTAQPTE